MKSLFLYLFFHKHNLSNTIKFMKVTKAIVTIIIMLAINASFAQGKERLSTIDFVQILNGNKAETLHYYENNWKVLREMALEKNYITSYEFMETKATKDAPFDIILITTYANKEQFELREKRFQELIKEKGALDLLNDKKPSEFRKNIFHKEEVQHH